MRGYFEHFCDKISCFFFIMIKERKSIYIFLLISKKSPRLFNITIFKFIIKNIQKFFQVLNIRDYFEYFFQ